MTPVLVAVGALLGFPPQSMAPPADPACLTTANLGSLVKRASPLDSVSFQLGDAKVKICYGRPSARGRAMIGGHHVPYGELWRTGANEPTMIHTTASIVVGGVKLDPGTVSIYTIPGKTEWMVIFNKSTEQWGDEGSYTEAIRRLEVGRAKLPVAKRRAHLEQLTIRVQEDAGKPTALVLEWEWTSLSIPLSTGG